MATPRSRTTSTGPQTTSREPTTPTSTLYGRLRAQWARKRTRLVVFFFFYFVFLSPVLVALVREFMGLSKETKRQNLLIPIMHTAYGPTGGPRFLVALAEYLVFQMSIYLCLRLIGKRIGIKLHDKTLGKHKDDILRLLYFAMTMALVGGIATRIDEGVVNTETRLKFLPLVMAYLVAYVTIFEICRDFEISLGPGLCSNRTGLVVVFTGFITVMAVLVSLFLTAWNVGPDFFAMFVGTSAVGFVCHCVLLLMSWVPFINGVSWTHLHHWYWPVPLAHMCVFHTDVSMIAQAIFLAIHMHGVCCFGVEPLFYDQERRARHPSDFDWQLREKPHEVPPLLVTEKGSNPNLSQVDENNSIVDETIRLLVGTDVKNNEGLNNNSGGGTGNNNNASVDEMA